MDSINLTGSPHFRDSSPQLAPRLGAGLTAVLVLLAIGSLAHADPRPALRAASDLSGVTLTIGPLGTATYIDGWDSSFGLEGGLFVIRRPGPLRAAGVTVGGAWFTSRDGGRGWVQGEVATTLAGLTLGASIGPTAELGDLTHPRLGAQGSLWVFAGIMPFVRVGAVQRSGLFTELGIRVAFPTLRW